MKICFLDVDGVLVSERSSYAYDSEKWDPVACALIKKLCKSNGYHIVCSSSWRHDHAKLMAYAAKNDMEDLFHPVWRTGGDMTCRGQEIQQSSKLVKTHFISGFSADNFIEADKLMSGKATSG